MARLTSNRVGSPRNRRKSAGGFGSRGLGGYPCACATKDGTVIWQGYVAHAGACSTKCDSLRGISSPMVSAAGRTTGEPTSFKRRQKGGTGQPALWKNIGGGKVLGLTTQQALIAVAVGVAAYFIIKKVK